MPWLYSLCWEGHNHLPDGNRNATSFANGKEKDMFYGRTNVPFEFELSAGGRYADISNEVEVDILFRNDQDHTWRVPAFWKGDNRFGVRFAAPEPGLYRFESVCNCDDPGLHQVGGALSVELYEGPVPLYRCGRLRVAANRRTLEHTDGTPFLWLGDTWWMGLSPRLDWPNGFRRLTADRVAKGFNVVQIVAGPYPDFDAKSDCWNPQQANEAGWSWEKGWTRINPGYYDLADLRIVHLVEAGIVPCILAMWGFYLPCMGVEKVKQHWRNLIARYGAFPVVWCMAER